MGNTSNDTNTFYGAMKYLCEYILTNYTTKQFFFITPIQRNCDVWPADNTSRGIWTNNNGNTLDQFVNAMIEVANYYSIPVLNLYNNCFSGHSRAVVTQYLTDGLHPNRAGHKIMARKIAKFINNSL